MVAVCALGACSAAVRDASADDSPLMPRLSVVSVTGIHAGKCGPRKVQDVTRLLQSLTIRDLFRRGRPCLCMPKPLQDLVIGFRSADIVVLRKPIRFPEWLPDTFHANIVQIIIGEKLPPIEIGRPETVLLIGGRDRSPGPVLFGEVGLVGDPFALAHGECS